jgi:NADPH2:quinone reductase
MHCLARPQEMVVEPLHDLMVRVTHDELRIVEGEVFGLSEASRAHEELQARRTMGKLLLDPSR